MASVIHKTTLQFKMFGNEPNHPESDWVHNPDLSSVSGVPERYWKAPPDWDVFPGPVEMTALEKQAADDAQVESRRDQEVASLSNVEAIDRAFMLAVLDEFNAHADKINEILDAADGANSLADFKVAMGVITDYPQRTVQQLINVIRNNLGD